MNLFEKMSAITNEITAVAKNLNVGWGKSSYKAAGEADILAAVKPIEEKFKVYSYPFDREILESAVLTTAKSDGSESKQQFMRVRTTYRFVDTETPSDYIDVISYGDGVDPQDKAPGKAMTYADKYALMKAYKIITGDDPDQYYSADLKGKEKKPSNGSRYRSQENGAKSRQQPQQSYQQAAQEPAEQEPMFVNAHHITTLKNEMARTGVAEDTVLAMAKVGSLEEITITKFMSLMKKFEKTETRQPAPPEEYMNIPDGDDGELPFN